MAELEVGCGWRIEEGPGVGGSSVVCCCWYLTLPVAYTCTKTVIKNKSEIMSKQKRIRSIKIIRAEQPKANKQITNLASIAEKVPSRTSDGGGGRRCHYYVSTSLQKLSKI